ncbi:transposase [Escherichia coli]|nr:transposase [Escherichia coli]
MEGQTNYAVAFQMYVLILQINLLIWMANQITSIC